MIKLLQSKWVFIPLMVLIEFLSCWSNNLKLLPTVFGCVLMLAMVIFLSSIRNKS